MWEIVVPQGSLGCRLDKFLAGDATHGKIERWIKNSCITIVNNRGVGTLVKKCGHLVREGDTIKIETDEQRPTQAHQGGEDQDEDAPAPARAPRKPAARRPPPPAATAATAAAPPPAGAAPTSTGQAAAKLPALSIVYEDDDVIVVNKPAGILVHPLPGESLDGTLAGQLMEHTQGRLSTFANDPSRPGIVHRIDKETSGLLIVAKTNAAHEALQPQLESHSVGRRYSALVWGALTPIEIQRHNLAAQRLLKSQQEEQARKEAEEAEKRAEAARKAEAKALRVAAREAAKRGLPPPQPQAAQAPQPGKAEAEGEEEEQAASFCTLFWLCCAGDEAGPGEAERGYGRPQMEPTRAVLVSASGVDPAAALTNTNGVEGMTGTIVAAIGRAPGKGTKRAVVADTTVATHPLLAATAAVVGARQAVTHFRVERSFPFLSLLDVTLETGRQNQIRVHMHHAGHPVFGDPIYGGRNRVGNIPPEHRGLCMELLGLVGRQCLHARELTFAHPRTGRPMHFEAPLPADMQAVLDAFNCKASGIYLHKLEFVRFWMIQQPSYGQNQAHFFFCKEMVLCFQEQREGGWR
ncbi:putative RluA family pseudouridine synthase [Paratrimastix pyriformis]|uniref:RluA family pseudouridine synthase n=1 Tax=Paratrimastix pyriformis TaxID=342808 RepID=A0ABQ8UJQ1_9EUKA|nr:putative RluA family pseudouridine synthase [Paratrimastix pyriformis]